MSGNADWTSISSPGTGAAQPSSNSSSNAQQGPPYPPTGAVVGGVPTILVDDPICAVFMALFLVAAAIHMGIFQYNKKHNHLFVFSAMMFAFCLIRAAALVMRIVWASHLQNVGIAMAANILTQAGTLVVFIVNFFFAQRIVRGYHPNFGWSTLARVVLRFLVGSCIACLIMVIAVTIQSFYVLEEYVKRVDRDVQLFAGTYLTVLAFLPIPIVITAALFRRKHRVEKFGEGSWTAKLVLILFTSTILTIGAGFRVGTNFGARPYTNPAWYHTNSAAFYVFNFVIDLIVAFTYIAVAFHKRFHIPNGAKGPGSYTTITSCGSEKSAGGPGSVQTNPKRPRTAHQRFSNQTMQNNSEAALSYVPDLPPGVNAYMRYADGSNYGGETDVESHGVVSAGGERHGFVDDMIVKVSSHGSRENIALRGRASVTWGDMPTLSGQGSGSPLIPDPVARSDAIGSTSERGKGVVGVYDGRNFSRASRSAPGSVSESRRTSSEVRRKSGV